MFSHDPSKFINQYLVYGTVDKGKREEGRHTNVEF
jgi:hypothetical protein